MSLAEGRLSRGIGGHHGARAETDDWLTPPELLRALGEFDLDPCASMTQPWRTAKRMLTKADNGLMQDWGGPDVRVWLNPPYGREAAAWLDRLCAHAKGTALIFARTETDMFFRYVWPKASALLFLKGRLNFYLPDGTRAEKNAGGPSVLVAYGDFDAEVLSAQPVDGKFVPLILPRHWIIQLEKDQSWREALDSFFEGRREPVPLDELYRAFASHPKTRANPRHWREKLRQTLQKAKYVNVDRGVWAKAVAA